MAPMFQLLVIVAFLPLSSATSPAIKAGYYPSWTSNTFPPTSIRFSYFTHVLYAFAEPDPTDHSLVIPPSDAFLISNLTSAAHSCQPPVRVLLSIGGASSNASVFASIAASPASRVAFISSSIAAARLLDLDGLDLDWEFPATASEMSDLGSLLSELRLAIEAESSSCARPPLLLSAAVYFAPHFFLQEPLRSYPVAAMAMALDWVNVMAFDLHGAGWEPAATGAQAALYDYRSNVSTSYGLEAWMAAGMPAGKVVMGIPVYGRTWTLRDAKVNGIGAPANGPGPGEPGGVMPYSDVVEFNRRNATGVVYDDVVVAAYSYGGTAWVGYDDRRSVKAKARYGRRKGMRGYFFWALGLDDKRWSLSRRAWRAWNP